MSWAQSQFLFSVFLQCDSSSWPKLSRVEFFRQRAAQTSTSLRATSKIAPSATCNQNVSAKKVGPSKAPSLWFCQMRNLLWSTIVVVCPPPSPLPPGSIILLLLLQQCNKRRNFLKERPFLIIIIFLLGNQLWKGEAMPRLSVFFLRPLFHGWTKCHSQSKIITTSQRFCNVCLL